MKEILRKDNYRNNQKLLKAFKAFEKLLIDPLNKNNAIYHDALSLKYYFDPFRCFPIRGTYLSLFWKLFIFRYTCYQNFFEISLLKIVEKVNINGWTHLKQSAYDSTKKYSSKYLQR